MVLFSPYENRAAEPPCFVAQAFLPLFVYINMQQICIMPAFWLCWHNSNKEKKKLPFIIFNQSEQSFWKWGQEKHNL